MHLSVSALNKLSKIEQYLSLRNSPGGSETVSLPIFSYNILSRAESVFLFPRSTAWKADIVSVCSSDIASWAEALSVSVEIVAIRKVTFPSPCLASVAAAEALLSTGFAVHVTFPKNGNMLYCLIVFRIYPRNTVTWPFQLTIVPCPSLVGKFDDPISPDYRYNLYSDVKIFPKCFTAKYIVISPYFQRHGDLTLHLV